MERHDEQKELFSYQVDHDQRWHPDHPLRRRRSTVNFTFAREAVAHTYATNENESVNPAVLLKLMLLLFSENTGTKVAAAAYRGCGTNPWNGLVFVPASAVSASVIPTTAPLRPSF